MTAIRLHSEERTINKIGFCNYLFTTAVFKFFPEEIYYYVPGVSKRKSIARKHVQTFSTPRHIYGSYWVSYVALNSLSPFKWQTDVRRSFQQYSPYQSG